MQGDCVIRISKGTRNEIRSRNDGVAFLECRKGNSFRFFCSCIFCFRCSYRPSFFFWIVLLVLILFGWVFIVCSLFKSFEHVSDGGLKFLASCTEIPEDTKEEIALILVRNGFVTFGDLGCIDEKAKRVNEALKEKQAKEISLNGEGAKALQYFIGNSRR